MTTDPTGNSTRATVYFPVRLPHDLRARLDQACALTGQPRAFFLTAGAEILLAEILPETKNAQSGDAAGHSHV